MLTALLAFIIRSLSNDVSFSWFLVQLSIDARAFINLNFMYPLFYSTVQRTERVLSASTAGAAAHDERVARALSLSRSKILITVLSQAQ
jgi:hypothetical protein